MIQWYAGICFFTSGLALGFALVIWAQQIDDWRPRAAMASVNAILGAIVA